MVGGRRGVEGGLAGRETSVAKGGAYIDSLVSGGGVLRQC